MSQYKKVWKFTVFNVLFKNIIKCTEGEVAEQRKYPVMDLEM